MLASITLVSMVPTLVFCQVVDALEAAEPYKEQLIKRGVLVVPLPIYSSSGSSSAGDAASIPALKPEDLRWRVTAINPDSW